MKKIITSYNSIITQKPKLFVFSTLILMILLSAGLSQFATKNDVRIWFDPSDPKLDTLNFLEKTFGNDETLVIAVSVSDPADDLFSEKNIQNIQKLTEKAWLIPQVIRVESITNHNHVYAEEDDIMITPLIEEGQTSAKLLAQRREVAINDKSIKGYLIDENTKLALIFAHLIPSNVQDLDYKEIIMSTRKLLKEYSGQGLEFHLTGKAALNYAFEEVSTSDVRTILPLLFILLLVYLFYIFRSFKAMVLPLFIVVATVTSTLGLGFWIGIKFSAIIAILPIILVAIAIADSVHILVNFFQFRGAGQSIDEALAHTVEKNFVPTFLTSFSTSVGLFSLMTTKLIPIKHLGLLAGIGCMVAWIFTITFLIPLLKIVPFKIPPIFAKKAQKSTEDSLEKKSFQLIHKFRYLIIAISVSISLGSLYLAKSVTTNADPDSYFGSGATITKANDVVKKYIGGSAGPDLIIKAGGADLVKSPEFLARLEKFNNWLRSLEPVNNTVSILDIIKKMNQVMNGGNEDFYTIPNSRNTVAEYLLFYTMGLPPGMDINNRVASNFSSTRISLLWTVYDTTTWQIYREKIKAKAKELNLDLVIAGKANLFQDMIDYVVETFLTSILMALGFVAILLMIVFRSIKIGLISLIPNLLPLTFGAATMAIFGMDLNLGTSLVASVCLGIAVDDTIHFLSNYLKNREAGLTQRENIELIFRYTGSALIITTLILSSAFGLYIFGEFLPNVNFGILCSVTLMSALIVDLTFLPALLLVIDKSSKKE
jgi:predicted RND superfamily exporter protein